ncbi:hypothetical protein MBAV_003263 [Candidatus Magnetobacterium bavaricum]|uniref:Uncharacterized protein n=1 Tax=Candidatus Magnetobacterium bavaricum TaxID=29290 RepID=A0A0F3GRG5_9BACT|nr:hypothetical protein MBAV_003263 [Candidatus Magnetobacterium bavaricum]
MPLPIAYPCNHNTVFQKYPLTKIVSIVTYIYNAVKRNLFLKSLLHIQKSLYVGYGKKYKRCVYPHNPIQLPAFTRRGVRCYRHFRPQKGNI